MTYSIITIAWIIFATMIGTYTLIGAIVALVADDIIYTVSNVIICMLCIFTIASKILGVF